MHRGQLERLTCHKFYEQIHPQAEPAWLCISHDTILRGVSKRRRTLHKIPPHTECSGFSLFIIHWSHCDYIRLQFICFCVCTCRVSRKSCQPNFKSYVGTPDFWAKVSQIPYQLGQHKEDRRFKDVTICLWY